MDPSTLRAAWWASVELRRLRRRVRERGLRARVSDPPRLPARAGRGVDAVLRRQPNTCLERALVLQKWLSAHGEERDVVVGAHSPEANLAGHAWVDGVDVQAEGRFAELIRLPPSPAPSSEPEEPLA